MASHPKESKKGKDSARAIAQAIIDLGAECPRCHSYETMEGNKQNTVRVCLACGNRYDNR